MMQYLSLSEAHSRRTRPPLARRASAGPRRGAATVELAIILLVFIVLVMGFIDVGMAIFRQQLLAEAAREGAREAIVHGKLAPAGYKGGPWGTGTVDVKASSTAHPIVDEIKPFLVRMDLEKTNIKVEWPENSNEIQKKVTVTVTTTYQPMITFIFGDTAIGLSASATMPIAH